MDDTKRYQQGMKIRRAVLGDEHVDRASPRQQTSTANFQDFITRNAWGDDMGAPRLPRHTRSLLTLAMMIALNRGEEFRMHVKAAFHNGVTRDQIKEVCCNPPSIAACRRRTPRFTSRLKFPRDGSQKKWTANQGKLPRRGDGHD
jgi:4-carboxymuconolactone decarboxylase